VDFPQAFCRTDSEQESPFSNLGVNTRVLPLVERTRIFRPCLPVMTERPQLARGFILTPPEDSKPPEKARMKPAAETDRLTDAVRCALRDFRASSRRGATRTSSGVGA
jgi:hypothetical protein